MIEEAGGSRGAMWMCVGVWWGLGRQVLRNVDRKLATAEGRVSCKKVSAGREMRQSQVNGRENRKKGPGRV
jgi:hypothetical protein